VGTAEEAVHGADRVELEDRYFIDRGECRTRRGLDVLVGVRQPDVVGVLSLADRARQEEEHVLGVDQVGPGRVKVQQGHAIGLVLEGGTADGV